jgi:hypothetical protein
MKATKTKMGLLELRKHWAQCIELTRGRVPDLPYAQESARDDETLILTARVDGFAGTGHVCQIEHTWLFDRS